MLMHHIPPPLIRLAQAFAAQGHILYGVGGMVRNPLMGLAASDYDVCSDMSAEEAMALCCSYGGRAAMRSSMLGAATLLFEGVSAEYTALRTEGYAPDGSHEPKWVRFTADVAEDARRRDFTVNAIYMELHTGRLADPLHGAEDVKRRLICATTEDPSLIMGYDAERVLRMCRFAAELGFDVEAGTLAAARAGAARLGALSPERVRRELDAMLLSDAKYERRGAPLRALELMERCGALDALLPEVTAGRELTQRRDYHRYDVMNHLLHAADSAPPVLELRLAALLHDIGKPPAYLASGKMYSHDIRGAAMAKEVLARLGYPERIRAYVEKLVRHHMYDLTGTAKEGTLRVWFAARGLRLSRDLTELRRADVHGSGIIEGAVESADRWERILGDMIVERAPFSESELNVTGADIMAALGIPPSPRVGEIKRKLLYHCAKYPKDNTRQRLMKLCRDMQ